MTKQAPNSDLVNLARRLVEYEATQLGENKASAAFIVTEKLRLPVSTLAGNKGYRLLISRALTIATANCPPLSSLKIQPDGSLDGLNALTHEAGVAVVAQLLALLVVFVGEAWVKLILLKPWPDVPITKTQEWEDKRSYYDPSSKSNH